MKWKKLNSKIVYKNQWLRLREDTVIRPDGKRGKYGIVERPPANFVIALDQKGKIIDPFLGQKDIKKKIISQSPPKPYNTTSLLADIYRYFGYSPTQGMSIAESLYQAGIISYPRTSSEKLPKDINYKKIITQLGKQEKFKKDAAFLLSKKELKPEEGSKTDQAHPAVYPTGTYKKMGDKQLKVYELVVRRFLACFGDPAKRDPALRGPCAHAVQDHRPAPVCTGQLVDRGLPSSPHRVYLGAVSRIGGTAQNRRIQAASGR